MFTRISPAFGHVRDWIFDLDNCLYPASTGPVRADRRAHGRLYPAAARLRPDRGAAGAESPFPRARDDARRADAEHHDVDPQHFLDDVHDIPLDRVSPDERLARGLGRLPGRKLRLHQWRCALCPARARRARRRRRISTTSTTSTPAIYRPKPDPHGYALLCERFGIDPAQALMVEDMARNLKPAKALGMTTVWVDNGSERGSHGADPDFIDHRIADVGEWLEIDLGGRRMSDGLQATDRSRLGSAQLDRPRHHGDVRDAVDAALRRAR